MPSHYHESSYPELRRTTRWLALMIGLLLSGCSSWLPNWDLNPLRGESFDGEMADYGSDLRPSKSEKENNSGLFTTRGQQIEKNLGY